MILRYSIENWMSFHGPVSFTMLPNREKRHRERIPRLESSNSKILPIASIFGGNASGKSNFVKSLEFARKLVLSGFDPEQDIHTKPFKLHPDSDRKPTIFKFELLIGEKIYLYDFSIVSNYVTSESLCEVENNEINLIYEIKDKNFKNNFIDSDEKKLFDLLHARKASNQLLLTLSQFAEPRLPVFDWFKNCLTIVYPKSEYNPRRLIEDSNLLDSVNEMLKSLDCGVFELRVNENSQTNSAIASHLETSLNGSESRNRESTDTRVELNSNGKESKKSMVAYHINDQKELIGFNLSEESDGTMHAFELLPIFFDLSKSQSYRVYVIDGVDQSMHTNLIRSLLEAYLDNCSFESRAQLIFTTHDIQLMDNSYLRRDEMWLAERLKNGSTDLFSIGDIKDARLERNIRESYIMGRFGGIPDVFIFGDQLKMEDENGMENSNEKQIKVTDDEKTSMIHMGGRKQDLSGMDISCVM